MLDYSKLTKQQIHDILLDKYCVEITDYEGFHWLKQEGVNLLKYYEGLKD